MPWTTISVKSKNQENISNNTPATDSTKSKISVRDILFGPTTSAIFFTVLSIPLVIISSIDLGLTLTDTTLPHWDPKITGILGSIFSIIISVSLMLMSYRKMNATVTPSNSN